MPSGVEKLNGVLKKAQEARAQEIAETEAWCAAAERAVAELKAAAAAAAAKAKAKAEEEEANANRNAARGTGFRAVRSLKRKGGRRSRKTRRSV